MWLSTFACLAFMTSAHITADELPLVAVPEEGPVVAVGGGQTPLDVYRAMLDLAGGVEAPVAVIPYASKGKRSGNKDSEEWAAAGATHVMNLGLMSKGDAHQAISKAQIIWLGGGAQLRLLETLRSMDLLDLIRRRHAAGVLVGGTSAGAAALSRVMISGKARPQALRPGAMVAYEGLGVWPSVIVDQHFVARKRAPRLLTAVLDQSKLVGVGVGEDTAVIYAKGRMKVMGTGTVIIYDARGASVHSGSPQAATGLSLHVLRGGMSWQLNEPSAPIGTHEHVPIP